MIDIVFLVLGESTSSGSTAEKYDEWPEFSPLGSLENMYEPIIPKEPPPPPPTGPQKEGDLVAPPPSTVPKSPSEGYLEPVTHRPAVTAAANEQKESEVVTPVAIETTEKQSKEVEESAPKSSPEEEAVSEERKKILASQPIYEEINGNGKEVPITAENSTADFHRSLSESLPRDMHRSMMESLTVDMSDSIISTEFPQSSPSQTGVSSGSEPSSACSTLSRPKPLPRKRSKRESNSFEQPYIAMNRPSITSALNETQLRDMLNQLTSMNLQTLRNIYTQYERVFIKEAVSLGVPSAGPLKWTDFDIYGKPVHSSERCVVYNAKLRLSTTNCQLMVSNKCG